MNRSWISSLALVWGMGLVLSGCTEEQNEASESEESTAAKEAPASQPASMAAAEEEAPEPEPEGLRVGELVEEKNGIKVSKLEGSKSFPDAKLFLKSPPFGSRVKNKSTFEFEVENYELGVQTMDEPMLANSADGQHIHLIVDNQPYLALYEPKPTVTLKRGSHVVLAFLSRSYHESIKHNFVLTRVHVARKTKAMEGVSLDSAPHLFYSRPKGEYAGKDAEKILLDFFLANTEIGPDGNKVEATINGEKFVLSEWVPYVIEGLPMGKATIGLKLVDAQGKKVMGPFNEVKRTITLSEG